MIKVRFGFELFCQCLRLRLFLAIVFYFSTRHCLQQNKHTSGSRPVHYSRDPQTSLFSNFFIKSGFHSTIHTFKNYFATMFSVFSFQQNKLYPNGP